MDGLAQLAEDVYWLAKQAGEAIMPFYDKKAQVVPEFKADSSPITIADKRSHEIIVQGLAGLLLADGKTAPVLSEEGVLTAFAQRQHWQAYWCVDPLDGTKDFLAHNDEFTVNIALVVAHKPVIGIIYVPVAQCGYVAWYKGGAYQYDRYGNKKRIWTQRPPKHPLRVLVSRFHGREALTPWLENLGKSIIIHQGSALKFCSLAKGEADLFLRSSPSSEWDNAAGQCLLEEAGGAIVTWCGEALSYNRHTSLVQQGFIGIGDPTSFPTQDLD